MTRLPCCEHGYMAGPDLPDVECCICSRSFCPEALADHGHKIRGHLIAEDCRRWESNPQPAVDPWAEVPF